MMAEQMTPTRVAHISISSRCRIAFSHAVSIPSRHRARQSTGGLLTRSLPAPPMARNAKTTPLLLLTAIRAAVTAASIRSPCCPSVNLAEQIEDFGAVEPHQAYVARPKGGVWQEDRLLITDGRMNGCCKKALMIGDFHTRRERGLGCPVSPSKWNSN